MCDTYQMHLYHGHLVLLGHLCRRGLCLLDCFVHLAHLESRNRGKTSLPLAGQSKGKEECDGVRERERQHKCSRSEERGRAHEKVTDASFALKEIS